MPGLMTAPALLADLDKRGFALRAVEGRLSVSPANELTTSDRDLIREHRDELLAILPVPVNSRTDRQVERWNEEVALRLMNNADALVEQLGISGHHPKVAGAAAMVVSAFTFQDLETVRLAVTEFTIVVRKVASEPLLETHAKERSELPLQMHRNVRN